MSLFKNVRSVTSSSDPSLFSITKNDDFIWANMNAAFALELPFTSDINNINLGHKVHVFASGDVETNNLTINRNASEFSTTFNDGSTSIVISESQKLITFTLTQSLDPSKYVWVVEQRGGGSISPAESYETFAVALSDMYAVLSASPTIVRGYFDAPYDGTIVDIYAGAHEAPTGSFIEVEAIKNGVSILSTDITIDDGEESSRDSATQPVLSDSAVLSNDRFEFRITNVGSTETGRGLIVYVVVKRA